MSNKISPSWWEDIVPNLVWSEKKHKLLQNSFRTTNGYERERHGGRLSQNIIGLRSSSVPRQRVDHVPLRGDNITVSNEWVLLSQWCSDSHHRASHYTRTRQTITCALISLRGKPLTDAAENPLECDRSIYQPAERNSVKASVAACAYRCSCW